MASAAANSSLQVMDYAMNVTTYAVEAQIGGATKLPHLIAYDAVVNKWIGFDTDTPLWRMGHRRPV